MSTRLDRPVPNYPDEAAHGGVSLGSVVTGALVTGAAIVVFTLLARAVASYVGYRPLRLPLGGTQRAGLLAAIGVGAGLFVAFLWGGYTAGRMARGIGWLNGLLVVVVAAVIAGVGILMAAMLRPGPGLDLNLRLPHGYPAVHFLLPRSIDGLVALGLALVGAMLGGVLGRRFHLRLERAALKRRQEAQEARDAFRDLREVPAEPIDTPGMTPGLTASSPRGLPTGPMAGFDRGATTAFDPGIPA